jgi:hypothetical protein
MARFYPYLQMEGLAYRLGHEKSADDNPVTNSERLMHNVFGIYDYTGTLQGDSEERRRRYAEFVGWESDALELGMLGPPREADVPFGHLVEPIPGRRWDVYRDENTQNLLGNYPAAMVRTGYQYLSEAQPVAEVDTQAYNQLVDKALGAFELARRFDQYFQPVVDLYPMILIDRNRSREALEYLAGLQGKVPAEVEERSITENMLAMVQVGEAELAIEWLEERLVQTPDRKFLYDLLFRINQHLQRLGACEHVLQRWWDHSGREDPAMSEALERMRNAAARRQRESAAGEGGP